MGEAFTNFFGGSPLNRLSWLRTSHSFLNAVVVSPATRWILFNGGQPLIASHPGTQNRSLALLTTEDVKPLLGAEPFFGQCEQEGEHCAPDVPALEAARVRGLPIVFLGLKEAETSGSALPSSDFKDPHTAVEKLKGIPNKINEFIENSELAKDGSTLTFLEPRAAMSSLDAYTSAIFAEARSMVDWNQRNKFCPACGSPAYSMWAGWKLACTSLLPWADNADRKPCPSGRGLHNFAHPRTDPVVIMLAVDESGEKILLGRNKKFPAKFYSALAGFIEPGETFEDAVKREMWEEAGVKVWNPRYHSGQPWPYPANLMPDSSAPIRTDLDNELEDAGWYTREEVLAVLRHTSGTNMSRRDYKKMAEIQDGPDSKPAATDTQSGTVSLVHSDPSIKAKEAAMTKPQERSVEDNTDDEPPFRMPPVTALAGVLIQHWAEGKIVLGADANVSTVKGNL
ncbi:NUDIX hydrolase domain-like protein [Suillus ampliporus]|nr:NUDIX hydrolase domain-like protein [Suillus ampliporus]